jgi:hypothetical protein
MKVLWLVLVLAACTVAVALAQRDWGRWQETEVVKCCIKSVALDTPATCREMGKLQCDQAGGQAVNDCSQCK